MNTGISMVTGAQGRRIAAATVVVATLWIAGCDTGGAVQEGATASGEVPQFEVDPFWPQPLPEDWILGQVAGLSMADDGNIWVVHRQATIEPVNAGAVTDTVNAMCCTPAPPVLEFNPEGEVVRSWGGPSSEYDWPQSMHGIHVDYQGNVWLGGNGEEDHQLLKFTKDGEFLMQIGSRGQNQGSHDTENVGGAATMLVDPETDELYVADGYQNRRVVVFDAETGEYRRHWGGYGEEPDDTDPGPYDPEEGPSRTFRNPVHGLALANDGLLYVSDRPNNRIQVFEKDGTYLREAFIRPETFYPGTTWYFGFSPDPEQRWMYIPDGTNNVIWILDRETLEVVEHFGRGGRQPGQFDWVHDLGVDADGNIYTTEVQTGHRIQKFNLVGGG